MPCRSDLHIVTGSLSCAQVREALSAELDGEATALPAQAVAGHLRGCASCTRWQGDSQDATRRLRLQPAPEVPDLAPRVSAAARPPAGRRWGAAGAWPAERALLLVLGLLQLGLSLPALLLGPDAAASLHVAREVGVTDVALAVGVLAAAWQPWRAAGMLPVVLVLAGGLAATSLLDIAAGRVSALAEAAHLLALADALLLALMRRRVPLPHSGQPASSDGGRPARLQAAPEPRERSA